MLDLRLEEGKPNAKGDWRAKLTSREEAVGLSENSTALLV